MAKPPHHKSPHQRKPLTDLFEGLSMGSSQKTSPNMGNILRDTFKNKGWPNWTASISKGTTSLQPPRLFYTIRMDTDTRAYVPLDDESPSDLFKKATGFLQSIQTKIDEKGDESWSIMSETISRHLVNAIFGSNYIERAGLGLEETIRICEKIFKGETVDPEDIPERDPAYERRLIGAITPNKNVSHIIRSRREVVQHALALQYIINEIVAKDKLLSEEIIRETHRILTYKIDAPGGTSWNLYSGRYRHIPVAAGNTNFVAPKFVGAKMQELVRDFHADIKSAEDTQSLDPFALAAKYCNDFVMIHPFIDGNGRMCRLILNAILLKYAGVTVAIGEHDESREEYLGIQRRASEQMEGSGELATLVLKKATARLRTMKQKLTGKKK